MTIEADTVRLLVTSGRGVGIEGIGEEGEGEGPPIADTGVVTMLVVTMATVSLIIKGSIVPFDAGRIVPMGRLPVGSRHGRDASEKPKAY